MVPLVPWTWTWFEFGLSIAGSLAGFVFPYILRPDPLTPETGEGPAERRQPAPITAPQRWVKEDIEKRDAIIDAKNEEIDYLNNALRIQRDNNNKLFELAQQATNARPDTLIQYLQAERVADRWAAGG